LDHHCWLKVKLSEEIRPTHTLLQRPSVDQGIMMKTYFFLFALIVNISAELNQQASNVCFGARGSQFGTFKIKKSGLLSSIKLVHKSGQVSCRIPTSGLSFWGCGTNSISAMITTDGDQVLFPVGAKGPWFNIPEYNSKSPELIYPYASNPVKVSAGQTLRLWYGEDLRHYTESDNSGKSCADVYADIVPELNIPAFPSSLSLVNGGLQVKKNNLAAMLPSIPAEYVVTFSVKPTSFISGWANVLHFTTGGNIGTLGYRIPGVWFWLDKLHICGSVKGNNNYCLNSEPVEKNKWTDIKIVNTKEGSNYLYAVYVNGKQLGKSDNPTSQVYKNVKVYFSDPWYNSFIGSIQNLKFAAPPVFQLQAKNVCFGAKGSQFGTFTAKKTGTITAFKLVHTSGKVTCKTGLSGLSFWGCGTDIISIAITNTDDQLIVPNKLGGRPWYKLPGYDSKSQRLVFGSPTKFNKVTAGQTLRLWFGEDLRHYTEPDNSGKSCADIYAEVV